MRTLICPAPLATGRVTLQGDEAHHAISVLRARIGEDLRLCDGQGGVAVGRVQAVGRHDLLLEVREVQRHAPAPMQQVGVVMAPPKGDRLADAVRMLCELGVGRIGLLATEHGERLPGAGALARCQRVAAEALKQCRRAWLPQIGPVWDIQTLATQAAAGTLGRVLVLDPAGAQPDPGQPAPTVLVVGPEGGFTSAERAALAAANAKEVCLADHVLRIETAAVAAAACWAAAWRGHGTGVKA